MTFGIKCKIQILKHQLSLFLCKTVPSFQSEVWVKDSSDTEKEK